MLEGKTIHKLEMRRRGNFPSSVSARVIINEDFSKIGDFRVMIIYKVI